MRVEAIFLCDNFSLNNQKIEFELIVMREKKR